MTYQEQYDIYDWLFSSIDELIDCNYLTNTMEDKNDELQRKGFASSLHGERTRQENGGKIK